MTDALPEVVAVFPLPSLVFLPGQKLPLHIFEPRYRAMVADALSSTGWLSVACVTGAEGDESPSFSPLATAGRIMAHQRLPDGRFNILVEGVCRVTLGEIPSPGPYRLARPKARRDPQDDEVSSVEHAALLHLCSQLLRAARARGSAIDFQAPMEAPPARLAMRLVDRFVMEPTTRLEALRCERGPELVRVANRALSTLLLEMSRPSDRGTG